MTGQVNIFRHRKIKALGVNVIVIVIAAMITIMTTLASIDELSVNAQMMGNHGGVWAGNMTSGQQQQQQQQHEQRTIINGTINLERTIFQAINSRINTSLTQAMSTAERSIGNDAFAVAAFGSEEGGYFAYRIILATPEMNFYWVKVDPGNGQILETEEVSQKELDTLHKEHSAMVVSNSGSEEGGVSGFPFIIPH
ncbi:MAG TPA: PepSY domain-containing protein [Nitrososphaeraceae archaeon]|nr:PepSY domain-containing protein [Nitrososphaeraceae archaeon]